MLRSTLIAIALTTVAAFSMPIGSATPCGVNLKNCGDGVCAVNTGDCDGGVCVVNTGHCYSGICGVNTGNCGHRKAVGTSSGGGGSGAARAPAIGATVPPLPNCDSANVNYIPQQSVHVFVAAVNVGFVLDSDASITAVGHVSDTSGCATGDGDHETGTGGAQFPETSQGACDPAAPVVGHHNGNVGATATVQSNTASLAMDYLFGTDGQDPAAWTAGQHCTGNNVVSDSYDTDPFDCGQGDTGHYEASTGARVSATLQPNPNPHDGSTTDPDPWATTFGAVAQDASRADPNGVQCFGVLDGSAWVFFVFGPSASGLPRATGGPLLDIEGCPVIGDSSSVGGGLAGTGLLTGPLAGNNECGIGSVPGIDFGSPSAGSSTPLQGTITAP
ncbi:MAG: hypothetical protein QOE90_886 [Thermoplasmata archaeon]|jgi:hypothetical protein|nr:hypothetical protein [Thermoplasmata archaeon]